MANKSNIEKQLEQKIGQASEFIMPSTGDIDHNDFINQFEVENEIDPKKLDMVKFMEEELTVLVYEPPGPEDPLLLTTCVNGRTQTFFKGIEQKVKRKFVECLARAKEEVIRTPMKKNNDGEETRVITRKAMLKYPFVVVNDPNPLGTKWLEMIKAQP